MQPRIRWRFLVACLGVAVVALIATLVVSAVVPGQSDDVGSKANAFTSTTRDYLLVIAFLTPLQAAGEEYLFRGYLTQAFGGLFHRAWIAVLVPAFLFGLAHGLGQSIPVFFDRFAFGLVAGVLVVLTGGLEAGIAMHVLNNWLAFGLALAYGDMASTLNPSGRQLVEHPGDPHPVAGLPRPGRARVPSDGAATTTTERTFWRRRRAACKVSRRSVTTLRASG